MLVEEIQKNKELKEFYAKNLILRPYKLNKSTIYKSSKFEIHSIVGTAFDFAIRATFSSFSDIAIDHMLKYLDPKFSSDNTDEIMEYNVLHNSAHSRNCKKKQTKEIYEDIVLHVEKVKKYSETKSTVSLLSREHADVSQIPEESFIYLAMVRDVFFKRDFTLLSSMKRRDKEINDLNNLKSSIKTFFETIGDQEMEIDRSFKSGEMMGGAESDIILGNNTIVDIKVVNQPIFTKYMIYQLISYAALAEIDGMKIEKVGIYFARHGHLEIVDIKDITNDITYISSFLKDKYGNGQYKKIKFNKPQKEFIKLKNPILSIAAPGSGKTETLIEKVSKEARNKSIHNILLITFTTKAANEMLTRLEKRLGILSDSSNIGTFHSVLFKLLKIRTYVDWDLILPAADMTLFNKAIRKNTPIKEDEDVNKYVQDRFGSRINDLKAIPAKAIFECLWKQKDIVEYARDILNDEFAKVVDYYLSEKKRLGLMNFDDILRYSLKTLKKNKEFSTSVKNRYKSIFVDEFQDTNLIQFEILKEISKENNVVAVGDPYQSIFGFMNARLENVINFYEEFNPTVVRMNINYRSTQRIVELTNAVTDYFKQRIESSGLTMKPLEAATKVKGDKIELVSTNAREQETFFSIQNDLNNGISSSDIAVIVRKNRDSSKLERLLTKAGISFRKRSGSSFYEKIEIQAILNTFLFWINNSNYYAFRGFASIFEGIGDETADAIADLASRYKEPVTIDFIEEHENELKYKRRDEVKKVLETLKMFDVDNFNDFELLLDKLLVVEKIIVPMKSQDEAETAEENMKDMIGELENLFETKELQKIEEELAVMLLSRSERDRYVDSITITTAHSSKGLEWTKVYLMDVSKGNFTECREDMFELNDEQIRLLYVAISRAKEQLVLIHQNQILSSKKIKPLDPIIEEILSDNPDLFKQKITNY